HITYVLLCFFFCANTTATTDIYTLSLHDALPIYHDLIAAFERGEFEEANTLQQKAIDMITLLGKYGGIATGKAYMKLIDLDCGRSEEHTSELQSRENLVCRLLLEKKK